jgi:hypothetical protein
VAQVVEHFPTKYDALSSTCKIAKKWKNKQKKKNTQKAQNQKKRSIYSDTQLNQVTVESVILTGVPSYL